MKRTPKTPPTPEELAALWSAAVALGAIEGGKLIAGVHRAVRYALARHLGVPSLTDLTDVEIGVTLEWKLGEACEAAATEKAIDAVSKLAPDERAALDEFIAGPVDQSDPDELCRCGDATCDGSCATDEGETPIAEDYPGEYRDSLRYVQSLADPPIDPEVIARIAATEPEPMPPGLAAAVAECARDHGLRVERIAVDAERLGGDSIEPPEFRRRLPPLAVRDGDGGWLDATPNEILDDMRSITAGPAVVLGPAGLGLPVEPSTAECVYVVADVGTANRPFVLTRAGEERPEEKAPREKQVKLTTHVRLDQRDDVRLIAERTGISASALYRAALDLFLQAVERRPILDVVHEIEARRVSGERDTASVTDEAV
jgi:hypothetical protein